MRKGLVEGPWRLAHCVFSSAFVSGSGRKPCWCPGSLGRDTQLCQRVERGWKSLGWALLAGPSLVGAAHQRGAEGQQPLSLRKPLPDGVSTALHHVQAREGGWGPSPPFISPCWQRCPSSALEDGSQVPNPSKQGFASLAFPPFRGPAASLRLWAALSWKCHECGVLTCWGAAASTWGEDQREVSRSSGWDEIWSLWGKIVRVVFEDETWSMDVPAGGEKKGQCWEMKA